MYKKSSSSRLSAIFTIVVWIIILSSIIVISDQMQAMHGWTATARTRIDICTMILRDISIGALIASIIAYIFYEIRHTGAIENIIVRRFLPIIRFFVTASVWLVTLFQILESLSVDTRSILTGAGIGGVILALAAKDVMTNLFGSLSILLGRVFDIGDTIRMRGMRAAYEGMVEEITLNYTRLTSTTGEVVYIPNRTIYTETVENLSRRRFETYVYLIPFSKNDSTGPDIKERMRIIEGKLSEYDPLSIIWETENPNAGDYVYRISVQFPEASEVIDRDIRMYLTEHIFRA